MDFPGPLSPPDPDEPPRRWLVAAHRADLDARLAAAAASLAPVVATVNPYLVATRRLAAILAAGRAP